MFRRYIGTKYIVVYDLRPDNKKHCAGMSISSFVESVSSVQGLDRTCIGTGCTLHRYLIFICLIFHFDHDEVELHANYPISLQTGLSTYRH